MRKRLRVLAFVLAVVSALAWLGLGANRGWTRTSVPVNTLDQVTGIEGVEYRKQFVPGVELLGCALLIATGLGAASFLFRKQQTKTNQT